VSCYNYLLSPGVVRRALRGWAVGTRLREMGE
jgi:hypothetical protein